MNVDSLIPLLGGAYCTYLGFRGVPAGAVKPVEWEQWYARWGRFMKIGGPLLVLMGAAQLFSRLAGRELSDDSRIALEEYSDLRTVHSILVQDALCPTAAA